MAPVTENTVMMNANASDPGADQAGQREAFALGVQLISQCGSLGIFRVDNDDYKKKFGDNLTCYTQRIPNEPWPIYCSRIADAICDKYKITNNTEEIVLQVHMLLDSIDLL